MLGQCRGCKLSTLIMRAVLYEVLLLCLCEPTGTEREIAACLEMALLVVELNDYLWDSSWFLARCA